MPGDPTTNSAAPPGTTNIAPIAKPSALTMDLTGLMIDPTQSRGNSLTNEKSPPATTAASKNASASAPNAAEDAANNNSTTTALPPWMPIADSNDPTADPKVPYFKLCAAAIIDTGPELTTNEIYLWILEHFPYFRTARPSWKGNIRYSLHSEDCLERADRNKEDNQGFYWRINKKYLPYFLKGDYRRKELAIKFQKEKEESEKNALAQLSLPSNHLQLHAHQMNRYQKRLHEARQQQHLMLQQPNMRLDRRSYERKLLQRDSFHYQPIQQQQAIEMNSQHHYQQHEYGYEFNTQGHQINGQNYQYNDHPYQSNGHQYLYTGSHNNQQQCYVVTPHQYQGHQQLQHHVSQPHHQMYHLQYQNEPKQQGQQQ